MVTLHDELDTSPTLGLKPGLTLLFLDRGDAQRRAWLHRISFLAQGEAKTDYEHVTLGNGEFLSGDGIPLPAGNYSVQGEDRYQRVAALFVQDYEQDGGSPNTGIWLSQPAGQAQTAFRAYYQNELESRLLAKAGSDQLARLQCLFISLKCGLRAQRQTEYRQLLQTVTAQIAAPDEPVEIPLDWNNELPYLISLLTNRVTSVRLAAIREMPNKSTNRVHIIQRLDDSSTRVRTQAGYWLNSLANPAAPVAKFVNGSIANLAEVKAYWNQFLPPSEAGGG